MLTLDQIRETADAIAARQQPDGRLPWHTEQHTDPWNHVEGAMGLALGGRFDAADRAWEWLLRSQQPDGAWPQSYAWDGSILDPDADTNMCAYIASGVWHRYLLTTDRAFLEATWPAVERGIDYVLDHQAPTGEIAWMHHADGRVDKRALLTASSSIYMSVRCAVAIAEELGHERPDWELSIGLLRHAIRNRRDRFWPKPRWSMDWYYPVLTSVIRGEKASERIDSRWDDFVVVGRGCRCVADRPWVTTAETCELVLALHVAGRVEASRRIFEDVQFLRQDDGAYQEGWVFPEDVFWPGRTPPWTAASVLLADDALAERSAAWNIFRGDDLPQGLGTEEVEEHLLDAGVEAPRSA
jgi:MMP endo-(1,4)-3-O-methyl-alpha-D-mannosidase